MAKIAKIIEIPNSLFSPLELRIYHFSQKEPRERDKYLITDILYHSQQQQQQQQQPQTMSANSKFWEAVKAMLTATTSEHREAIARELAVYSTTVQTAPEPVVALDQLISDEAKHFIARYPRELGISPKDLANLYFNPNAKWRDLVGLEGLAHLGQHLHELPTEAFAEIARVMQAFRQGKRGNIGVNVASSNPVWKKGFTKFDMLLNLSTDAPSNLARGPLSSFVLCLRTGVPTLITRDSSLATMVKTLVLCIWQNDQTKEFSFGTGFVGVQPAFSAPTLATELKKLATPKVVNGVPTSSDYDDVLMQKVCKDFFDLVEEDLVYGLYVEA